MSTVEVKLAAATATRKLAADSLYAALNELLPGNNPISEEQLRDLWLEKLRSKPSIYLEGWYNPPPHGMAVLFSTDEDVKRTNYEALRPAGMWPRDDIFLDRQKGIIMVYASPVHRATHMIGDFEMMLYFGNKQTIKDHFRKTLGLDWELFESVQVGMTIGDVARTADELFIKYGLANNVVSLNDPTGTNVGHTIPATDAEWTQNEQSIFDGNDWDKIKDVIAKKRRFVNKSEDLVIQPGLAFTIEPRPIVPDQPDIPLASFHTTVVIHPDGRKEWLTDFDQLFRLAGMDYMPRELSGRE